MQLKEIDDLNRCIQIKGVTMGTDTSKKKKMQWSFSNLYTGSIWENEKITITPFFSFQLHFYFKCHSF